MLPSKKLWQHRIDILLRLLSSAPLHNTAQFHSWNKPETGKTDPQNSNIARSTIAIPKLSACPFSDLTCSALNLSSTLLPAVI
jgi:hypothetical protein